MENEKQNDKKRKSYADDIVSLIWTFTGLALLVIFIGCLVLLFLTEDNQTVFYIKSGIMLGVYLLVYLGVSFYIEKRIRKSFEPLDKLYKQRASDDGKSGMTLLANDVYSAHLKIRNIEKELDSTKKDLEEKSDFNDETISTIDGAIDNISIIMENRKKEIRALAETFERESALLSDIDVSVDKLKSMKNNSSMQSLKVKHSVKEGTVIFDDTIDDMSDTENANKLLVEMLNKSQSLMDDIYSELTSIQTMISRINVNSMNASLEAIRSGNISYNLVSTLDEIKDVSGKLNDKSDEIALLIIQQKNAVKLAFDQAVYSGDELDGAATNFEKAVSSLKGITEDTDRLIDIADEILDNVYSIASFSGELYASNHKKTRIIKTLKDSDEKMLKQIKRMNEQTTKNK